VTSRSVPHQDFFCCVSAVWTSNDIFNKDCIFHADITQLLPSKCFFFLFFLVLHCILILVLTCNWLISCCQAH
jgi:hypothetical protein